MLYNLAEDPGEKNDLVEKHPQMAKKLFLQFTDYRDSGRTRPVQ
jgi:hypothetical protein